jgi:hypothetical protein
MTLQNDFELSPWIYGLLNNKPHEPGGFLKSLAECASRADFDNYSLLRPALVAIAKKYPEYSDEDPENPFGV